MHPQPPGCSECIKKLRGKTQGTPWVALDWFEDGINVFLIHKSPLSLAEPQPGGRRRRSCTLGDPSGVALWNLHFEQGGGRLPLQHAE